MAKKFVRHAIHKKKKLAPVWRRPRGLQSKLRLNKKGHKSQISTGYGAPKSEKGKIKGMIPILVSNSSDLSLVKEGCIVVLSRKLGDRKRTSILKVCVEKKLKVLNVADSEAYIKKISDKLSEKKEKSNSNKKIKSERQKELESRAEKKEKESKEDKNSKENKEDKKDKEENIDSKLADEVKEEKKKKEKEEKDKVLTSKGN